MKASLKVASLLGALLCVSCTTRAGYNPPPERRASERCPINEVWVCTDRSPSRVGREDEIPMFCRCEHPDRIH